MSQQREPKWKGAESKANQENERENKWKTGNTKKIN